MSGAAVIGEMYKGSFDLALNDWYRKRAEHREDTAVQRRVKDLTAAGLSPTLAAGSAASTSGPIQVRGPDLGNAINQAENTAISKENSRISRMNAETQLKQARIALLRGAADIATTHAQIQLLEQQKRKMKAEADVASARALSLASLAICSLTNLSFASAHGHFLKASCAKLPKRTISWLRNVWPMKLKIGRVRTPQRPPQRPLKTARNERRRLKVPTVKRRIR